MFTTLGHSSIWFSTKLRACGLEYQYQISLIFWFQFIKQRFSTLGDFKDHMDENFPERISGVSSITEIGENNKILVD